MILTLPRHVAQSADLSARARIPAISQLLVAAALALARLEERLEVGTRSIDLSNHFAKDIGLDRLRQNVERPSISGPFSHL